jgi:hypothetical protein
MRGPGNRDRKTNAYEVQCLAKDIRPLSKMLEKKRLVIPYRFKRGDKKEQQVFYQAIGIQDACLANTYVIKVTGINEEMMGYLRPHSQETPITNIVPTHRTSTEGEWRLLVHQKEFNTTILHLRKSWNDLLTRIPEEAKPSGFNTVPTIESRDTYEDDDSESGESYATALTGMFSTMSNITLDDGDFEPIPTPRFPSNPSSYANAVRQPAIPLVVETPIQMANEIASIREMMASLKASHKTLEQENRLLREQVQLANQPAVPGIESVTATAATTTYSPVTDDSDRMDRIENSLKDVMVMFTTFISQSVPSDKANETKQPPPTPEEPKQDSKRRKNTEAPSSLMPVHLFRSNQPAPMDEDPTVVADETTERSHQRDQSPTPLQHARLRQRGGRGGNGGGRPSEDK